MSQFLQYEGTLWRRLTSAAFGREFKWEELFLWRVLAKILTP